MAYFLPWGVTLQLKIVTWQNEELASDALKIQAYQHYEANDYGLAASYVCGRPALAPAPAVGTSTAGAPEDRAPLYEQWWRDGDEPTYYIISPKVGRSASRFCRTPPCFRHTAPRFCHIAPCFLPHLSGIIYKNFPPLSPHRSPLLPYSSLLLPPSVRHHYSFFPPCASELQPQQSIR